MAVQRGQLPVKRLYMYALMAFSSLRAIQVKERSTSLQDVCQEKADTLVIFPELRDYIQSWKLCRSLGGSMAAPYNSHQQEELINATEWYFKNKVIYDVIHVKIPSA